eukprot:Ihof_evm12s63 gene=Ihof_evmTU12s63
MAKTGGDFAVVTRRKTNNRGIPLAVKIPDARVEAETTRLIRFLFTYNPKGKRKLVCLNGQHSPPWAYASDAFPSNSIEFVYHPDVYKTRMCPDGEKCREPREKCGYLHPHEVFLPPWRCQGLVVDGYWYPPDPVTYDWFRYLMLEFKTGDQPCRVKKDHDIQRCPYWHIQADPTDRREPVRLNPENGRWIPLPNNSPLTAVRFHPMSYKRQACIFIESQREKCIRGRYCTHSHLGDEIILIPRYLEKLKAELLSPVGALGIMTSMTSLENMCGDMNMNMNVNVNVNQNMLPVDNFASDGYPSPPLSTISSVAHSPPTSPRLPLPLTSVSSMSSISGGVVALDVVVDTRRHHPHRHSFMPTNSNSNSNSNTRPETVTPPTDLQDSGSESEQGHVSLLSASDMELSLRDTESDSILITDPKKTQSRTSSQSPNTNTNDGLNLHLNLNSADDDGESVANSMAILLVGNDPDASDLPGPVSTDSVCQSRFGIGSSVTQQPPMDMQQQQQQQQPHQQQQQPLHQSLSRSDINAINPPVVSMGSMSHLHSKGSGSHGMTSQHGIGPGPGPSYGLPHFTGPPNMGPQMMNYNMPFCYNTNGSYGQAFNGLPPQWRPDLEPQMGQQSMFSTPPFQVSNKRTSLPAMPLQPQPNLTAGQGRPRTYGNSINNNSNSVRSMTTDPSWLSTTSWSAFASPSWSAPPTPLTGSSGTVTPLNMNKFENWSADDVMRWAMGQLDQTVQAAAPILRANDIDGSLLPSLDDHSLRDMGMLSFGMRAKLLTSIAK